MGGLLANRAGGVILPRERMEVGRDWLSRSVRRNALRVGDRDRPADVHVKPRRWRPAWEGRRASSPRSGPGGGVPQRRARGSRFCHACRGGWLAFLATSPAALHEAGTQSVFLLDGFTFLCDSLCPVRLSELLGFILVLSLLPAFGEVSQ